MVPIEAGIVPVSALPADTCRIITVHILFGDMMKQGCARHVPYRPKYSKVGDIAEISVSGSDPVRLTPAKTRPAMPWSETPASTH